LLILEGGKHRCTATTLERLRRRELTWTELLIGYHDTEGTYHPSIIEYVDPQEAETTLIEMAFRLEGGMNPRATHCEVHPSLMLGVVAATICFPDHNQSPRNTYQSAMGKQAMGIYCTNFNKRLDSMGNILNYSMVPLVQTNVGRLIHQDKMPNGNNAIVAIMAYSGFNMEDSLLVNQSAIDRGFYHSTFYRTYKDEERKNQVTGEEEKFGAPDAATTRGLKSGSYQGLQPNGFIRPNVILKGGDVIIGKSVPLRGGTDATGAPKPFHDQSTTLRHNESGVSDHVFESRNGEGYRFAKVRIRSTRIPGIGDKFSSCHGQKGTVGMVFQQEDMPFVAKSGIVPDMIINPHCIPSRMTMGQLYESILGKCGVELGARGDGTAFNDIAYEDVCDLLERCGMERHGNEVLTHGQTGERIPCAVFMGPIYEQRLKHMVEDKMHSRSTGPKMMLTRQPAEGRARDGGLRIGEMERDCMIAHGVGSFLKERMLDMSDRYAMHVGRTSGLTSAVNKEDNICHTFGETRCDLDVAALRVPYGWKLLSQELQAMAIAPRLKTKTS
jgi:DNA-directed RNA polymerase II subunit RPB2